MVKCLLIFSVCRYRYFYLRLAYKLVWTLKRSKGRVCVSPIDAKKKAKGHNKGFPVKQHRESH